MEVLNSATLTFTNQDLASQFTKSWGRATLTGYTSSAVRANGGVEIMVYNVDSHKRDFIEKFIAAYGQ